MEKAANAQPGSDTAVGNDTKKHTSSIKIADVPAIMPRIANLSLPVLSKARAVAVVTDDTSAKRLPVTAMLTILPTFACVGREFGNGYQDITSRSQRSAGSLAFVAMHNRGGRFVNSANAIRQGPSADAHHDPFAMLG